MGGLLLMFMRLLLAIFVFNGREGNPTVLSLEIWIM